MKDKRFGGFSGIKNEWRGTKGEHTMRMCVSRDKNLECRVTRSYYCELTADFARKRVNIRVHTALHSDTTVVVSCKPRTSKQIAFG